MEGTYVNSHEQSTLQNQGPRDSPRVFFDAPTLSQVAFSSQLSLASLWCGAVYSVSRCILIVHVISTTAALVVKLSAEIMTEDDTTMDRGVVLS